MDSTKQLEHVSSDAILLSTQFPMKMSHVRVRFGWLSLVHAWNLEVFASLLNFTPFSAVLMLLSDINNAVHGEGSAMCQPQEPANLVL